MDSEEEVMKGIQTPPVPYSEFSTLQPEVESKLLQTPMFKNKFERVCDL